VILGKTKGFTRLSDMKCSQVTLSFPFQEDMILLQARLRLAAIDLATNHLGLVVETRVIGRRRK
jgi:hypothetical protein